MISAHAAAKRRFWNVELVGTVFLPDRPTEPAAGRAKGGFSPLAPDPVRLLQKGQIGINGWSYFLG